MRTPAKELLEAFVGELPAGVVSIREGVDDSGNEYVETCPRNPGAARIRVLKEDTGEYVLGIGRGTIVEILDASDKTGQLGRGTPEDKFLEICRAVAKGEFLEKVSSVFGRNQFVRGQINLKGCVVRSNSGLPLVPWWRTIRYDPY